MPVLDDASGFSGPADAIFTPATEAELQQILRDASARGIPVTIAGAGTGVAGGRVPQGGWALSLEKFTTLEVAAREARAGAGILLRDLQSAALRTAQFYAPDPTETAASVGGSVATNASGSRSFRYGATRAHILGLRAAFIDGSVREFVRGDVIPFALPAIRLPATTKNTAGYPLAPGMDWIDLIAGSEGTLAVVTEARLRLLPAVRDLLTGVVFFESDDHALAAVDAWRLRPRLRMVEYLDRGSLDLLRPAYSDIPHRAAAALMIEEEIDGDGAALDEWAELAPPDAWFAAGERDRERFRRFRHALPETVNTLVRTRGLLKMGTDFAVPFEHNRDMLAAYRRRLDRDFSGRYVIFGHIGDAHLHVNLLPASAADADLARDAIADLAAEAVQLGGTVSAEHGLGKRKANLLTIQYPPGDIEAMRSVKRRLDPQWLLGRGTLFSFP